MKVLVAHPGLQYSHLLAQALYEAGHLLAFWSGVPLVDAAHPSRGWGRFARLRQTAIPTGHRTHYVLFPFLRRLIGQVCPAKYANSFNHRLDNLFDRWVARRLSTLRPDMVICYENSAAFTFRAAKGIGAVCVLDAASVHFREGARLLGAVVGRDPPWVERQKGDEISLADGILVLSPLAADSYVTEGVARSKVRLCELGIDSPPTTPRARCPSDKCRFIFVGSLSRRKGVDVLLDVIEGLHREGAPATLTLVGGAAEHDLVAEAHRIPVVRHHPFMQRSALFEELAQHDCLILPSRLDSFGQVVPEAMSVGVPAIVSDRTGAKSIIERHPGSGWIVPFEAGAIRDQMQRLIDDRQQLTNASPLARRAAENFTLGAYRKRVVDVLRDVYRSSAGSERSIS